MFEITVDKYYGSNKLYLGFGNAELTQLGDTGNIAGIFCFKASDDSPSLSPQGIGVDSKFKPKLGDVLRCELDTKDRTIKYFSNGSFVGEQKVTEDASKILAPFVTIYSSSTTIKLKTARVKADVSP